MKIHENTALLDAFVDGELTAAEMAEVQAHLAECPDCQAYVDDALAIRADFPTAESTELPADFAGHVMQAVAKTPRSRPKKQPWGKLAAAAACLAVIVLVQYGAGLSRSASNEAAAYTADCAAAESTEERSADASSGDDADSCQPMDSADDSGESDSVAADGAQQANKSESTDGTQQENKSESTDGTASIQSAYQNGKSVVTVITDADEEADLPTVRVSAAEIGDLLDDRTPTEQKDTGVVRYLLTRTEFDALAEELADRGVTLETEDTDSSQLWLEVCGE